MKRLLLSLCLLLILTGCGSTSAVKDDNLKRAIDRVMTLEEVKVDEIIYLDASFLGIENLDGIEVLTQLETLTIANNMITSLEPLKSLKQLKLVDIQNNRVKDLTPLRELEHLEVLLIRNNPVESIEVIESQFSQLKTTDFLVHVKFEDPELELAIRENLQIPSDQLSYFDLEKLRRLDLSTYDVKDISGLEHAKNLEVLIINKTIINPSIIGNLKELKHLELSHASLIAVPFIEDLNKLEYLDLSYNKLTAIDEIKDFNQLKHLDISRNKISDVSVIHSEALDTLYIEGNYISDYNDLPVLDQIKTTDIIIVYFNDPLLDEVVRQSLNKENGVVTDRDLKSLTRLIAPNKGISNIGGIELLENLIEIDLSSNAITDLTPIETLTDLQVLKLKDNNLEDITSLIYLKKLSIVDLSDNNIMSLEAFTYLPNLEYLYLGGNDLADAIGREDLINRLKGTDDW